MRTINQCLDKFCTSSRAKVSIQKTEILFSKNVPPSLRTELSKMSGFESVSHLGKYMGVPLFKAGVNKTDFAYILDKVKTRLSGW